ncbi:MAG: hypothetical protein IPL41_15835 [Micropruina sp.]|nr:hypothetical protein [Micropruina sp.]
MRFSDGVRRSGPAAPASAGRHWSDLAAGTLARQFPADVEPGDLAGLLAAVESIQSQTGDRNQRFARLKAWM